MTFGIMGGLRIDELVHIENNDVEDHNNLWFVRIPKSKTKVAKSFTIHDEYYDIVKRYMSLRPVSSKIQHQRFFLNFQRGKCTIQPVGKNKFAQMPKQIAEFLKLENSNLYTGR